MVSVSSGTGSPGQSRTNGRKMVVVVVLYTSQPELRTAEFAAAKFSARLPSMIATSTLGLGKG